MRKLIIALVVASASLVPGWALSQTTATAKTSANDIQADAPSEYTVQKGDTLWGIAGKFLKEPWKWPQIWQMNREQIKNPHLIYPGDLIRLDRTVDGVSLSLVGGGGAAIAEGNVVRVEPRTRIEPISTAIPSVPGSSIAAFLTEPMVVESGGLNSAPTIVATEEERVVIGPGDVAYVNGLSQGGGVSWQIYRPGEALVDPETGETLGYEAVYLGDARVKRFGSPSTIEITRARQEINRGDRLVPAHEVTYPSYVPRAPDKPIKGAIVSVQGAVSDFAQYSIITINRGSRDGLEVGHVLVSLRRGDTLTRTGRPPLFAEMFDFSWYKNPEVASTSTSSGSAPADPNSPVTLPDERSGIVFIFRTFEKLSYALVLKTVRPISVGDVVQSP